MEGRCFILPPGRTIRKSNAESSFTVVSIFAFCRIAVRSSGWTRSRMSDHVGLTFSGSQPKMRKVSCDQKRAPVCRFKAQLPLWVSLCACDPLYPSPLPRIQSFPIHRLSRDDPQLECTSPSHPSLLSDVQNQKLSYPLPLDRALLGRRLCPRGGCAAARVPL